MDPLWRFVGKSAAAARLRTSIKQAAASKQPILLIGETGTGKAIVARSIHEISRSSGAFVDINCAGIPSDLLRAELFGAERGAFTGAETRAGLIETADGGTLMLDEVDTLPRDVQRALLSVIDSGQVRRLGSPDSRSIDVRLIATANRYPAELIAADKLSADFVARIAGFVITLPPLRERTDDIPALVNHFVEQAAHERGHGVAIDDAAIEVLRRYDFPGNVRELANIVERAAMRAPRARITERDVAAVIGVTRLPKANRAKVKISDLRRELDEARKENALLRTSSIRANPIWEGRSFDPEDDYAFVLMPFSEISDIQMVYRQHTKRVVEDRCGLRCERADDIYGITGVMQSVWEGINRARLVVAELTGRNANVFYELGIAHTLGKPVVMLSQSIDDIPFDLRHLRCILYQFKPGAIEQFERNLERTVRNALTVTAERGLRLEQRKLTGRLTLV